MDDQIWRVRRPDIDDEGIVLGDDVLKQCIAEDLVSDEIEVFDRGQWIPISEHPSFASLFDEAEPPSTTDALAEAVGEHVSSDLTPLVDVVFQLIIFFMIATTFTLQKSLAAPSGSMESSGRMTASQVDKQFIVIHIDQAGSFKVSGEQTTSEELPEAMRKAMGGNRGARVAIDTSSDAPYKCLVEVIDAANQVGIERVQMIRHVESDASRDIR